MLWKPYCLLYKTFGTDVFDFDGAERVLGRFAPVTLSRLSLEGSILIGRSGEDGRRKKYRLIEPENIAYGEAILSQIPPKLSSIEAIPSCGLPYRFLGSSAARIYHREEISPFFEVEVLRGDVGKWVKILVNLSAQVFVGNFFVPARRRELMFELKPSKRIGKAIEFKGVQLPPPDELFIDLLKEGTNSGYLDGKKLASALRLNKQKLLMAVRGRAIADRIKHASEATD